jgi:hypothetical protein
LLGNDKNHTNSHQDNHSLRLGLEHKAELPTNTHTCGWPFLQTDVISKALKYLEKIISVHHCTSI